MDGNTDTIPESAAAPESDPALRMIPVRDLFVWANNPRKGPGDVADLAASVKKTGVRVPLIVRKSEKGDGDCFDIIAGQRRYHAAQMACLASVPCIVVDVPDDVALELAMAENAGRVDAPPLDDADALHALVTVHKRTPEQIAESIGRPVQWVRRRLSLLALCERARIKLTCGDLPLSHAYQLAAVDHETQERVLTRYSQCEVPSARIFGREVTSSLRTLQSAPFDIADSKLPGGSCNGCTRRTDAQTDLFGGAETGARCLGAECWDGKVSAVWERAQKGAKRRKGLAVIQDTITLSYDHTCVVRGDVLTARPREGAEVIAIGRTAWGKVVELYEPEEKAAEKAASIKTSADPVDSSEDSAEDADRSAQKAQESARKAAASAEKRATLARLYDALTGSRTGLHTGLRVALLTCARDLDMSRDLRAVCEATGRNVLVSTDADIATDIADGDLAVMLAATIVSAWALDKDAEDGTVMERSLREMLRARETEESEEKPVEGAPIFDAAPALYDPANDPKGAARADAHIAQTAEKPVKKSKKGGRK